MSGKSRKHELPNVNALNDAYNSFVNIATSMTELNNLYLDHAKNFFQAAIVKSQKLYEVSTPEDLSEHINSWLNDNGAMFTKAFLEDLNVRLKMMHELCGGGNRGVNHVQNNSINLFDFYSKLLPSPLMYKFDDVVKNAAAGNHDAIKSIHTIVQNAVTDFGNSVQSSAESTLDTLKNFNNKNT